LPATGFLSYYVVMLNKSFLGFFLLVISLLSSCVHLEESRKTVEPKSESGNMPWNRPLPGEGTGQFGGMLERR
jgi:hypothetical protein